MRFALAAAFLAGALVLLKAHVLAGAGHGGPALVGQGSGLYPGCDPGASAAEGAPAPPVIRLHVVAASDAPRDQAAKLRVRDAVAPWAARLAAGASSAREAFDRLRAAQGRLAEMAATALGERQPVSVEVGWRRFAKAASPPAPPPGPSQGSPAWSGGGPAHPALPAGCYPTVLVTLGRGQGHNWWCVLYPPVCLPLASAGPGPAPAGLAGGDLRPRPGTGEVRVRWYALELAGRLEAVLARWRGGLSLAGGRGGADRPRGRVVASYGRSDGPPAVHMLVR